MALSTPTTIPGTVAELADQLELLANAAAGQYGEHLEHARSTRHVHSAGFLLGVCTALALATGRQSDDVYQQMLGGRIR